LKKTLIYQFFENTFSLFTLKHIDLGLEVFLFPFLIVMVRIDNYRRYVFGVSFMFFFVNISNYGFDLTTVRYIAKCHGDFSKINILFNKLFSVKLYLTLARYLVLLICISVLPIFISNMLLFIYASSLLVAAVCILNSKWEGFGHAAVEELALGKPFLASNVPGLKEII